MGFYISKEGSMASVKKDGARPMGALGYYELCTTLWRYLPFRKRRNKAHQRKKVMG